MMKLHFRQPRTARGLLWTPPTRASAASLGLDSAANRKASSSSSSVRTGTSLHGPHRTCLEYQGNSSSTSFTSDLDPSRSSSHFSAFQRTREEQSVKRLLIRPKRIYNFCLLHASFV